MGAGGGHLLGSVAASVLMDGGMKEESCCELVVSQIQALQALAELVADIPTIPEECRRCPHGGDLHVQRFRRFRWLASGLMWGLERVIKAAIEVIHENQGGRYGKETLKEGYAEYRKKD